MNTQTTQQIQILGLKKFYKGKVRDVYFFAQFLIMWVSDRISAFDVILPKPIPYKGQILNEIADHFLQLVEEAKIVPVWRIKTLNPDITMGHLCEPFKIEMVVRGYLEGSMEKDYREKGQRVFWGIELPDGLKAGDRLPQIMVTPTTKADSGHDVSITDAEIIAQGLATREDYDKLEKYAKDLFLFGSGVAQAKGLILVDTKYEFGKKDGVIYLMDEVHTPDSSRYYYADGYEELQKQGKKQRQLSKEFVRQWLKDQNFEGKEGQTAPDMPDEFIQEISNRYKELYKVIMGKDFVPAEKLTDDGFKKMAEYEVRKSRTKKVLIIVGSDSDLKKISGAADVLDSLEIGYVVAVASAHRAPVIVKNYIDHAEANDIKVIIAGAGGAAHLPGVVASKTLIPVIGLPLSFENSLPYDSLLSIVQMPPGIPVASVGLNAAQNAALYAAQIIAISDTTVLNQLREYRMGMASKVRSKEKEVRKLGYVSNFA